MDKYLKLSPEGTRDYLFEECSALKSVEELLNANFERHAYHRVMTPTMEYFDLFAAPCVGFDASEVFKLTDSKGRILALRADSTAPIARLTATKLTGELLPIRLFYNQPIFMVNPRHSARNDEVMQAGIELIGSCERDSDLEVLALAASTIRRFSPKFRLEIGHMGFFNAIADELTLSEEIKEQLRKLIEHKSYASLYEVLEDCRDCSAYAVLAALPRLFGGIEVLDKARSLFSSKRSDQVLDYIKQVYESLKKINPGDDIMIDLGLVHRNDYYTGILFSCYLDSLGGAVLSGGRYDNLLKNFGTDLCAIGFGVNVDLLTMYLLKAEKVRGRQSADILIFAPRENMVEALRYREALADKALTSELLFEGDVECAKRYALERGIERIAVVGEKIETISVRGTNNE